VSAPNNGFYTPVAYRGAFKDVNWASDWTFAAEVGLITGEGAGLPAAFVPPTPPVPPVLTPALTAGGDTLQITIASEPGFSYQLESRPDFDTNWSDDGAPQSGTGGNLTFNVSGSGTGTRFFRVRVQ
jgi:hypothetical protein